MPTFGAFWFDQPIAALPGTQGYRVDSRQPGHFPDRIQTLAIISLGNGLEFSNHRHRQGNNQKG